MQQVREDFEAEPEQQDQAAADKEAERLQAFGGLVSGWVREAIDARDSSGIESRWREDLKQYYGEDLTLGKAKNLAEQAADGPQTQKSGERQTKSRIVVNITRPKTNAAMARMGDMLLPVDDKNWGIQPTPVPELSDQLNDKTQLTQNGQPLVDENGEPATVATATTKLMQEATKRARAMEREIDDQLTECNYNAQQRKGLWDLTVLGTMVIRGPFAHTRRSRKWQQTQEGWTAIEKRDIVPEAVRVSPWNFYPDPACGGEIQNCRYVVESIEFNAKTLRALRGQDGYIDSEIVGALNEGPKSLRRTARSMDRRYVDGEYQYDERSTYESFLVHGQFTKGDLMDAIATTNGAEDCTCPEEERQDAISGCVILVNGRVIKALLSPLYGDDLPYSVAQYEKIDGQLFGVGIPFVLRNPQRVITAAWRMTMDNAATSSGGQFVMNRKLIEPADGSWVVTGSKVWYAREGTEDVNKAFAMFQVDTRQQEMMQIIDKAMQFSEDESSMPAIMEGSTTDAPQTVGVATTLSNNANTVMRRLVKMYDDDITDPTITRFYDWTMLHSDKEEIKGDFQIDARGTSVLLVRDMQKQALAAAGQFVLHPQLSPFHLRMGYDWLKMFYESNRITPDSILVPDEEVAAIIENIQKQAQQQPQAPQIAVAQIKAQAEGAKLQATMQDAERERQHDREKFQLEYELELIKYANENKMKLEDVRARMTELLLTSRHEERMQEREAALKLKTGSGL